MFVFDTCALIWWTLDPAKLSKPAADACRRLSPGGAFTSSISIWEIGIKIKKRKLDIGMPIDQFVTLLHATGLVTIVPVDETIWVENLKLSWKHPDPADRTIVATAEKKGVPIMTADVEMKKFYRSVIW